jgi:competence protein ComEA
MRTLSKIVLALLLAAPLAFAEDKPAADAKVEKKEKKAALVDLNSAGVDDLKKLPDVDDAIAKKIVDGRPWKRKDELVKKGVIDKAKYDKIGPLVIAHQAKPAAAPKAAPAKAAPPPADGKAPPPAGF